MPMPKEYIVWSREIHRCKTYVQANSKQEALEKFLDGEEESALVDFLDLDGTPALCDVEEV